MSDLRMFATEHAFYRKFSFKQLLKILRVDDKIFQWQEYRGQLNIVQRELEFAFEPLAATRYYRS